jgi:hypothetical protein
MNKFKSVFGELTEERKEAIRQVEVKKAERLKRKRNSQFCCIIPDWTGEGGMREFWINEDGSFESEDDRIQDREIRRGIKKFAEDWA